MLAHRRVEAPGGGAVRLPPERKTQHRIADRAGHHDGIADPRARARHHPAVRDEPERRNGDHRRPRRAVGIAAEQRAAIALGILAEVTRRTNRRLLAIVDVMAGPERGALLVRERFERDGRTAEVESGYCLRSFWIRASTLTCPRLP